jgi:protoheme IX farnesyltransferase
MMEKALTWSATLDDYLVLTKPRIVALVLLTTLTGLYLGGRGFPDSALVLWTLLGTGLAAAGAAVLNNVFDREIDGRMERTRLRPIPAGSVHPLGALVFGGLLIACSFLVLSSTVNLLSALFAMAAVFFYVVVYTLLMKRKTPLATEFGGISGALPPVIGCAAVQGAPGLEATILFMIMFIWQPPHFWVLAVKYVEDYRRAGVPVLPVAHGIFDTKVKTLFYTATLLPLSLLPYFYGIAGKLYFLTAFVLSLAYLLLTVRYFYSKRDRSAFLFFYSIVYLAVLFMAMVVDMVPR